MPYVDSFQKCGAVEFSRCASVDRIGGCVASVCGLSRHYGRVIQAGFSITDPSLANPACANYRTLETRVTRDSDGALIARRRLSWRQRPIWQLDSDPSGFGTLVQGFEFLPRQVVSVSKTRLVLRYFIQNGGQQVYTVTGTLSDEITREEIEMHLFTLAATFDYNVWFTPASNATRGLVASTFDIDGGIRRSTGPVNANQDWIPIAIDGQPTVLTVHGDGITGSSGQDGFDIPCDGATREEMPAGGIVVARHDLYDSNEPYASPAGQGQFQFIVTREADEATRLWNSYVIGRRWDSKYDLPPNRCYHIGFLETAEPNDRCLPHRWRFNQYVACGFNTQLINNGTRTGFIAPLPEDQRPEPDHIIAVRCLPSGRPPYAMPYPGHVVVEPVANTIFNLSCPP